MNVLPILLAAFGFCCQSLHAGAVADDDDSDDAKVASVSGRIASIILYRDSALVTREIKLDLVPNEVVVKDLPDQLQSGSVFAEKVSGATIRGVRVRAVPIQGSSRQEIQDLDAKLKRNAADAKEVAVTIETTRKHLSAIERMLDFGQASASEDLKAGTLNPEMLLKLVDSTAERRTDLEAKILAAEARRDDLRSEASELQRLRNTFTSKVPRRQYDARIFLQPDANAEAVTLRLRYTVSGCDWSPQYSVHGELESDAVDLRYGAVVTQMSGEDWRNVQVTLSTASPSVNAAGPTLAPVRIVAMSASQGGPGGRGNRAGLDDLFNDDQGMSMGGTFGGMGVGPMPSQMSGSSIQSKMKTLRGNQVSLENDFPSGDAFASKAQRDVGLNRFAGEMQQLEFMASRESAKQLSEDADREVASQTYELPGPITLESRQDQQLVEIEQLRLKGEIEFVATPLLSSFAYRQVETVNASDIAMLKGPATMYLDDRFVGVMQIPSTAVGQRLLLGFGADDQIRTRRELVDKIDSLQGGNRRVDYRYKLVLANFKKQPVDVRLVDRIPTTQKKNDISVRLGDLSHPISDDSLYQKIGRPEGILRWELQVPAAASGAKAMDVTYNYQMELARDKRVAIPNLNSQVSREVGNQQIISGMGGGMGGMGMGGK